MRSNAPRKLVARKLLVAAVGVATVSFVEACGKHETPSTEDGSHVPVAGNLALPVRHDAAAPTSDASAAAADAGAPANEGPARDGGARRGVR